MSLYNQILGTHPFAGPLFALLGLNTDSSDGKYPVGRIRDMYIVKRGEEYIIILYTRNGGGNRESNQNSFDALSKHPNYIKDYDCELDSTYAYVEFSIPKGRDGIVKEMYDMAPEERGTKMFMKMIDDLKNNPENPFAKKALEVGKKVMGAIDEASKEGNGGINIIEV